MDLFEILFIALFVLIPVFDGILKKRKAGSPGDQRPGPGRRPAPSSRLPSDGAPGGGRAGGRGGEGGPAADMVPEDLWELLTGERRASTTRTGAPQDVEARSETAEQGLEAEPWSAGPEWTHEPMPEEEEAARSTRGRWDDGLESEFGDRIPEPEPVSLEYVGPEAYSLEQPLPPPEVRHARFHAVITPREPEPRPAAPPILRSLRRPSGLRDAVVLAEILGRPKGLE